MTHPGLVRPTNQDTFGLTGYSSSSENESQHFEMNGESCWALVADGMGGHRAGAYASKIVVEFLSQRISAIRDPAALPELLASVNQRVHEAMFSEEGDAGMGTTIVGFRSDANSTVIFNVGDSRAYLLRRGQLSQVSFDHTPEGSSNRGNRSHRLTQSLGGTFHRVDPVPHVVSIVIQKDDVILLCSDGLTDLVRDDHIRDILNQSEVDPASDLVNAALTAGGRDNVTAVLLKVKE